MVHPFLTIRPVNVKWGKELLKDIEVDPSQQGIVFKSQVYALTNVPVAGQKIMVKGKMVKDNDEMSKFGLKNGATVMLMGTAEGNSLKEPEKPIVFLEDMTPEQRARALNQAQAVVLSPGLENLGNTCYMASTVQILKRVNELKAALQNLKTNPETSSAMDGDSHWALSANQLMTDLESKENSFAPYQFVQTMRQTYPIFDEKTDKGGHKQQDADECYQAMLQSWRAPLQKANEQEDIIGNLFEIELENDIKCLESPDEPATSQKEKVLRLSCHIDNNNNPINSLAEGLKISFEGQVEKNSPSLGRNALYSKTSRINKLVSDLRLMICAA